MFARTLDLFSRQGADCAPADAAEKFEAKSIAAQFAESIHSAGLDSLFSINPCIGCALVEYCSDDCGQHLFDLDTNDPYQLEDYE